MNLSSEEDKIMNRRDKKILRKRHNPLTFESEERKVLKKARIADNESNEEVKKEE